MKILVVTKVQLDRPFGGSRHVLAVCRELIALGHDVLLLGPGEEDRGGLTRIRTPTGLKAGVRLEAIMVPLLVNAIRVHRPDVVYLRISATNSLVPLAVFALRMPLVLELNGPVLDELRAAGRPEAIVRAMQAVLRPIVRRADALIAPSENIRVHAEVELGSPNAVVVRNGADLEIATPGDRHEARRRLGVPDDRRWIAFIGTMVPEQRVDLLCRAHASLDGVGLLVAGGGPRTEEIERWAREAPADTPVRFFGAVPHEKAIDVIRAADVCVSARDGDLGMKPFEYAAVGRRMVLFAEEGIDRLLAIHAGEEAVFAVKEKTVESLARALKIALDVERNRGPLTSEFVDRVRREVGWKKTAEQIIGVIERVLSTPNRR